MPTILPILALRQTNLVVTRDKTSPIVIDPSAAIVALLMSTKLDIARRQRIHHRKGHKLRAQFTREISLSQYFQ